MAFRDHNRPPPIHGNINVTEFVTKVRFFFYRFEKTKVIKIVINSLGQCAKTSALKELTFFILLEFWYWKNSVPKIV